MAEKLYTVGQIGKKYKVPLKEVYAWARKLQKIYNVSSRGYGLVDIPNDLEARKGIPESLVKIFPNLPVKKN